MGPEAESSCINWQAFGAIATFLVVLVALVPIWRDALRTRSHARNLRVRLCSKLAILRPSLGEVMGAGQSPPGAILSPESFAEIVRAVSRLLEESVVLDPEEQSQLSMVLANLELASVLYGTSSFTSDSAKNNLDLVDRAISLMGEYGLLSRRVQKPWEN